MSKRIAPVKSSRGVVTLMGNVTDPQEIENPGWSFR